MAKGYCDLNIPLDLGSDPKDKLDVIRRALTLGYQTLALCLSVDQKDLVFKKQSKKKGEASKMLDFPEPPVLKLEESDYPDLAIRGKSPVILTRLNVTFQDNDFLPIVSKSETIKKYDIVSVCPESTLALQNLLKSFFRPDVISFVPENVQDVRWSRKLYNECVEKSIYFELSYAPMIRDSTARRRIISQSHNYQAVGKSKNIIISSEARSPIEVRGPHDAANLGYLLGLNEQQCKAAVGTMSCQAIRSAAGRKLGPYRATVVPLSDLEPEASWKVPTSQPKSDSEPTSGSESEEMETD